MIIEMVVQQGIIHTILFLLNWRDNHLFLCLFIRDKGYKDTFEMLNR